MNDALINEDGEEVRLEAPTGIELPPSGFDVEDNGYLAPVADGSGVSVVVSNDSERLQLLTPFAPWDGQNLLGAKLLIKAFGKCTTDHISMAGPWLRFRGHLDNISNNCLIGAVNAYNQKPTLLKTNLRANTVAYQTFSALTKLLALKLWLWVTITTAKVPHASMQPWNLDTWVLKLFW